MENHQGHQYTTDIYHDHVSKHEERDHDIHENNASHHENSTEIDPHTDHDFSDHHGNHSIHEKHFDESFNHTDLHDHHMLNHTELHDHHELHHTDLHDHHNTDHNLHHDNHEDDHAMHYDLHDIHHANHSLHHDHANHGDHHHGHDNIHKYIEISIAAAAVLGNLIVIYVICRSKKMRSQFTNWLIINQSVLDVVFGALIILVNVGSSGQMYSGVFWEIYCRIIWSKWPCWSIKVSSSYNLVALSLERYVMTVHPLKYRNFVKPKYIIATIATVWSIGNIVPIFTVFTTRLDHGICKVLHFWPSRALFATFGVANTIIMVIIPIGIMSFVYLRIYRNIRRHGMQVHAAQKSGESNVAKKDDINIKKKNAREMNILITAIIVVVCYAICNVPESLRILVAGATDVFISHDTGILGMITIVLFHLDCVVNPIIYTAKYEVFRKEFVKYVLCNKIKLSKNHSTSSSDSGTSSKKTDSTHVPPTVHAHQITEIN